MNVFYDEQKGVYRVNNDDGTFDTYTKKDYESLMKKSIKIEDEEPDVIIDAKIDTPSMFSKIKKIIKSIYARK